MAASYTARQTHRSADWTRRSFANATLARRAALRVALTFACSCLAQTTSTAPSLERTTDRNFSVLHISDIHVVPHLAGKPIPASQPSTAGLRWIADELKQPLQVRPEISPSPSPAFALATGDLTEYGFADDTAEVFEQTLAPLPCRVYVAPGNHDNTWVASYSFMRRRHGGENYSFDHAGCHFICLCSASPQEPLPTFDGKTRAWLRADLERVGREMPVFIAFHHPLLSDEFANPIERETLLDLLRDYNVVLLLYGHGHNAVRQDNGGISGVMGGAAFGPNTGFGLLTVHGDAVHYAYRFMHDPAQKGSVDPPVWKVLWQGRIAPRSPQRHFNILEPVENATVPEESLRVRLRLNSTSGDDVRALLAVDGQEPTQLDRARLDGSAASIPVRDLLPGAHLLTVSLRRGGKLLDTRTRVFQVARPAVEVLWRKSFAAGFKAAPQRIGDWLVVAGTDGILRGLDPANGDQRWTFATRGEILGTPASSGDTVVFGSGDGQVRALRLPGAGNSPQPELFWSFDAGAPVYGPPLVASEGGSSTVYIGDNVGRLHALALSSGSHRWRADCADFSIESAPAVWGDLVAFGAWDGNLYALRRTDGALRWTTPGPSTAVEKGSRYYAPADCGPVLLSHPGTATQPHATEQLFVCDRGYRLGVFDAQGRSVKQWTNKACATAVANGALYVRTTDDHVLKLDVAGNELWRADVPAGRFPVPPAVHAGVVYVCSNRGRLSALAESDGKLLWSYQATAGFYVMAPVAVCVDTVEAPRAPVCYVAGMDGSLTAVRSQRPK